MPTSMAPSKWLGSRQYTDEMHRTSIPPNHRKNVAEGKPNALTMTVIIKTPGQARCWRIADLQRGSSTGQDPRAASADRACARLRISRCKQTGPEEIRPM